MTPRGCRRQAASVADAAISGLLQPRKTLPAKLFYDEEGCRLFRQITELPEYYLTRTEHALLSRSGAACGGGLAGTCGAGGIRRQRRDQGGLPAARRVTAAAIFSAPMCRSTWRSRHWSRCASGCGDARPELAVYAIAADFMDLVLLPDAIAPLHRLGFFPGSTIGNLDPAEAQRFLRQVRVTLGSEARFLVGVDLRKDTAMSASGIRRRGRRDRGVQSQPSGAAEPRGRCRFRPSRLRPSRGVERRGEPDRDASGQPPRSASCASAV